MSVVSNLLTPPARTPKNFSTSDAVMVTDCVRRPDALKFQLIGALAMPYMRSFALFTAPLLGN